MRLLYMIMAAIALFLFISFQWAYSGDPTFLKGDDTLAFLDDPEEDIYTKSDGVEIER